MASRGWEHITVEDTRPRSAVVHAKPSKYRAVRTTVDGIVFDSAAEARHYSTLKLLVKVRAIDQLECQPAWELHAPNGEVIGRFVADFRYRSVRDGLVHVDDVKGMKTLPLARWKQRHVLAEYGVVVKE